MFGSRLFLGPNTLGVNWPQAKRGQSPLPITKLRVPGVPFGPAHSIGSQHISFTAHRLQITRLLGIGFDLAAQAGDLNVHRAFLCLPPVAAKFLDQFGTAYRRTQVFRKYAHQLNFCRGQAHGDIATHKFRTLDIVTHPSHLQHLRHGGFGLGFGHTAQDRVDTQK